MVVFFTGIRLKYRHDAPIQSKLQHFIKQMFKQNFFMELHGGFFELIERVVGRSIVRSSALGSLAVRDFFVRRSTDLPLTVS